MKVVTQNEQPLPVNQVNKPVSLSWAELKHSFCQALLLCKVVYSAHNFEIMAYSNCRERRKLEKGLYYREEKGNNK